ncbi:MAG TPA: extracellular solute-binding protein [Chloroflexota bacterium]
MGSARPLLWLAVGLCLAVGCAPAPAAAPAASAPNAPAPSAPSAAGAPAAPASSSALDQIVAGARQEGVLNVVWSAETLGGKPGADRIIDSLNRRYGLSITSGWTPGPAMPDMAVRIQQEQAAQRPATSDVYVGTEAQIKDFVEKGGMKAVDWTGLSASIPPSVVAPKNAGVEVITRVPGVTYNSSLVPANLVPKTAADLLKPEWKGKLASTPYGALFDVLGSPELWGPERVLQFTRDLSPNLGGLMRCGETERLISGEYWALAFDCGDYEARSWQQKGAPIASALLTDAFALQYWWLGVPENSAHPNAATLYVLEAMSPEGQAIVWDEQKSDQWKLPGSRIAGEIKDLEKQGAKIVEANVPFMQSYPEQPTVRQEVQGLLRQGR